MSTVRPRNIFDDAERILALLIILIALSSSASVARPITMRLTDIPSTHWASREAKAFTHKGWMRTFPDGTFRGNAPFTRQEAALLFSKAVEELFPPYAVREKKASELRRELADLRWEAAEIRHALKQSTHLELSGRSMRSPVGSPLQSLWRLSHSLQWSPNEDQQLQVELDTLDAPTVGGGTSRQIPDLIDFEWRDRFFFRGEELGLSFTAGPDKVIHIPSIGQYSHEVDQVFVRRPLRLELGFPILGFLSRAAFHVIRPSPTGQGTLRSTTLAIDFGKGGFPSELAWHVLPRGSKVEVGISSPSQGPLRFSAQVWGSGTAGSNLAYHMRAEVARSTTDHLLVTMTQAGSQFRKEAGEELEWLPYSLFGRSASNGRTQITWELSHRLFGIDLSWQSEWLLTNRWQLSADAPGASQTHAVTISLPLAEKVHGRMSLLFFESPSRLSWLGGSLPSPTNTIATLSLSVLN